LPCYLAVKSSVLNFKTGRVSPAHEGSPDGTRRMPRGQGLPPLRPDGAVAKGPEYGGLGDEKDDDDDDDVDDDSPSLYLERWVLRSGTPGSFGLAGRGTWGLWRLWFPLKGDLGRPLFSLWLIPDPGIL
jgi:hypothetical protein